MGLFKSLMCKVTLMLNEHWASVSRLIKEQKYKEQTKIHSENPGEH